MKALVVDDSGLMRKIIIRELLKLNMTESDITEASDGREALQAATSNPFDLILMDWNMPNMLGIDAVKAIRAEGVTTPILMVTTEAERANVVMAIQAGANNYLIKPFTGEGLLEKVQALIGGAASASPPPIDQLVPEAKEPEVDIFSGKIE